MSAVAHTITGLMQSAGLPERRVANIFQPLGTQAETEYRIAVFTIWITAVIFVVVAGLLTYTIWRFRRRPADNTREEPPQVYGSNQIEIAWTLIPILGVFVLMGVTGRFIFTLQDEAPPKPTERITVVGHQWWWEARYAERGIVTANEIHIPVSDRQQYPILLQLESADVIHSFWVPQLSGKTDLIPGRANTMWIDAREPGIYVGNCAEYCGTQHANMLLRVVAEPKPDFEKWAVAERSESLNASAAAAGKDTFETLSCVDCHTIRGTVSQGAVGPDLTHLMRRTTLASGMIPNNVDNLRKWIDDPQLIKPGCLMPAMKLTPGELTEVVAYMQTLR